MPCKMCIRDSFHTAEAQTVVDVFTHFYVMAGFLDVTGIDDTVDGHIGLRVSHAGSGKMCIRDRFGKWDIIPVVR